MTATQDAPDVADPIARAYEIADVLAANARETEEQRRLTDETLNALIGAGMFRLNTPPEYGGTIISTSTMCEVVKVLARSCASAAWIAVILNSKFFAYYYDESVQKEIFAANPDTRVASIFSDVNCFAQRVEGGYRVSGRWPFASGIHHAQWGIGLTQITEADGTVSGAGFALMPIEDLTVDDTWYTVGMRGTGSNTMVATDVFVPERRMLDAQVMLRSEKVTDPSAPRPMRAPLVPNAVCVLSSTMVGVAQAGLAYVSGKASTRGITYTNYAKQTESQAWVRDLGEIAMMIESADLHLKRGAGLVDAAADELRQMSIDERRLVRADVGHAMAQVTEAFNWMMSLSGAAAFSESNPLAKMWRDANTGARHGYFMTVANYENYGAGLLGLPLVGDLI